MLSISRNKKSWIMSGFTLVELLVVVTIIGVMFAFSMAAYGGTRKTSRDQKRKADLEQIRGVLEIYRSDCQSYPAIWNLHLTESLVGCNGTTYMTDVPADPKSPSVYRYKRNTQNTYCLCAILETGGSGTECDCGNQVGGHSRCGGGVDCNYFVNNP